MEIALIHCTYVNEIPNIERYCMYFLSYLPDLLKYISCHDSTANHDHASGGRPQFL